MNLIELSQKLRSFTDQQLSRELQRPSGQVPSYLVLAELNARKEKRPKNPPKTTVAQDISDLIPPLPGAEQTETPQPALGSGLAALAKQTAGLGYEDGGIVSAHHRPQDKEWTYQEEETDEGRVQHHSRPRGDTKSRREYMLAHPDLNERWRELYWDRYGGREGVTAPLPKKDNAGRPMMAEGGPVNHSPHSGMQRLNLTHMVKNFAAGGPVLPKQQQIKSVARENYRLNPMPMPMRGNFLSTPAVGNNWFGGKTQKKSSPKVADFKRMPYDRQTVAAGIMAGNKPFQNFADGGIVGDEYNFFGGGGDPPDRQNEFGYGTSNTSPNADARLRSLGRDFLEIQRRRLQEGEDQRLNVPPPQPPAMLRQPRGYPPAPTKEPTNADEIQGLRVPGTPAPSAPPAPFQPGANRQANYGPAWQGEEATPATPATAATTPRGIPSAPGVTGTRSSKTPGFEDPESIYNWLKSKEPQDDPYKDDKEELAAWKQRLTKSRESNMGMTLMNAGLGMMASKSPWVSQAFGEAGQAALKEHRQQEGEFRKDELVGISASAKLREAQQAYQRGEFEKAHKALDDYRKKQLAEAYLMRQERLGRAGTGLAKTDIKEIDQQNIANRQARNNAETKQSVKFELYQKLKRMPTEQELSGEIMRRYPVIPYKAGALNATPGQPASPGDPLGLRR